MSLVRTNNCMPIRTENMGIGYMRLCYVIKYMTLATLYMLVTCIQSETYFLPTTSRRTYFYHSHVKIDMNMNMYLCILSIYTYSLVPGRRHRMEHKYHGHNDCKHLQKKIYS